MADHIDHSVNVVVAQSRCLLGGPQLGGQRQIINSPAQRAHDHVHGVALTGTRVADIDALALEIGDT